MKYSEEKSECVNKPLIQDILVKKWGITNRLPLLPVFLMGFLRYDSFTRLLWL